MIYSAVYAVFGDHKADGFIASMTGNTLATVAGVAIGLPVALVIARRQQQLEERAERNRSRDDAAEQRKRLLEAIRQELCENERVLNIRLAATERQVQFGTLEDDLWTAAADAQALRYLDVGLLRPLASIYHDIRRLIWLDQRLIEAKYLSAVYIGASPAARIIDDHIQQIERSAHARVKATRAQVGAALGTDEPCPPLDP